MKGDAIYLTKQDARILQDVIRKARGGFTSRRPVPVRRRPMGGGGGTPLNIVHGQAVGAVATDDATFDIDQIELMNGAMPSGVTESSADTIEVANPFALSIRDNELVRAEQADDGTWIAVAPWPKMRDGKATSTITAATGQASANWGGGTVQFWDDDGVNDGSAITIANPAPEEFLNGAWIKCDFSKTPPRLISGSCAVVS